MIIIVVHPNTTRGMCTQHRILWQTKCPQFMSAFRYRKEQQRSLGLRRQQRRTCTGWEANGLLINNGLINGETHLRLRYHEYNKGALTNLLWKS